MFRRDRVYRVLSNKNGKLDFYLILHVYSGNSGDSINIFQFKDMDEN